MGSESTNDSKCKERITLTLRRGCVWFAVGLILAVAAGFVAITSLQGALEVATKPKEEPKVQVLVATRDIPLHTVLAPSDVALRQVPPATVPEDSLADPKEAVGQMAIVDIAQGEVILRRRLLAPDYVGPKAAFVMDPKKVIVAFPAYDLLGSADIIRPGDRVDIMFTFDFGKTKQDIFTGMNTLTVLQDVQVAAILREAKSEVQQTAARATTAGAGSEAAKPAASAPGAVVAILLAVDPQDALTIKYFRDAGGSPDLALRSPAAKGLFDVVPVDGDYLLGRYHIRWQPKTK